MNPGQKHDETSVSVIFDPDYDPGRVIDWIDRGCINMDKIIKNKIMTLEEHREMGRILQDLRNGLIAYSVELDGKFGKSKGFGMKLERAVKRIDKVRSQLDDHLFDEYPDLKTDDGCRYYY